MTCTTLKELSREVSDEDLEYLERLLFYEFDDAYRKHTQDGLSMDEEILALEKAMESLTLIRETLEDEREQNIEETVSNVDDIPDSSIV